MPGKGEYKPNPSYGTMHARVKYARGKASDNQCRDCDKQATDWCYDHLDPAEVSRDGKTFSEDVDYYVALCRTCHRKFDDTGRCRNGHPWTEDSTYHYRGYRMCRICRNHSAYEHRERRGQNG